VPEIILKILKESIQVTLLVGLMMILVDAINVITKNKLALFFRNRGKYKQYIITSLIGSVPGCLGGFTNVSLYIHGMISFGALAGSMIAVSGDEAFVMLAMFPDDAVLLFAVLFLTGALCGIAIDKVVLRFKIRTSDNCGVKIIHPESKGLKHYMTEHIYRHILKKHLWKIALWTFLTLLLIETGSQYLNLEQIAYEYKILFLAAGALVGLIPESGPHLIFVTLYAKGLIPFSVLLTSSIVQDGHGMLPLLSYSFKDSMKIKVFNFSLGLLIGLIVFLIGY
jgi:hypothetical protein